MRYRLLALAMLLLAPVLVRPDVVYSCDARIISRDGRNIEGQTTRGQSVGIIVPCMSKAELAKLLQLLLAKQEPEIKDKAIQALYHATDVSLALTTQMDPR